MVDATFVLAALLVVAVGWGLFATWQMFKFAKIIFLVEDTISDGLDALSRLDQTLTKYLSMRLFWDGAPDIKVVLDAARADIAIAKSEVQNLGEKLTRFSKQKYILEKPSAEDEERDQDDLRRTSAIIREFPEYTEPVPVEELLRDSSADPRARFRRTRN